MKTVVLSTLLGFYLAASVPASQPRVRANGILSAKVSAQPLKARDGILTRASENGKYQSNFKRNSQNKIHGLIFTENNDASFEIHDTDASSVVISNDGTLLLTSIHAMPHDYVTFTFYSKAGNFLGIFKYPRIETAEFSRTGNHFLVSSPDYLDVIHTLSGRRTQYRPGRVFDVSHDGSTVVVAKENLITVYRNGNILKEITTPFIYNRDIVISQDQNYFALADINNLRVFSLPDVSQVYSQSLPSYQSFRSLNFSADRLLAGVKYEDLQTRRGILNTYHINNKTFALTSEVQTSEPVKKSGYVPDRSTNKKSARGNRSEYPELPWPFFPQDEPQPFWNDYEGLNSNVDGGISDVWGGVPYLHQGVDLLVPANTPVYSIDTGVVVYTGDLGMDETQYHIAVAPSPHSGYYTGMAYGHLIEGSLNYAVGDTIHSVGLHLGDIYPWPGNVVDGHIMLFEVRDHGNPWSFADDEWSITYNVGLSFTPYYDNSSPELLTAVENKSMFGYTPNNSGYGATFDDYFFPDSARGGVSGDIDIVVKLIDYNEFEDFTLPAFETHYWIRGIDSVNSPGNYNKLVVDTTLGQIHNHTYNFFSAGLYKPNSRLLYKVDDVMEVGGQFNKVRTYAHVLTNNNGDSLAQVGEADSALHTADFYDGWYRVYVKAMDLVGNSSLDSEAVYFNNGNIDTTTQVYKESQQIVEEYSVRIIPGGGQGEIHFEVHLPKSIVVSLDIFDVAGNPVSTLLSGRQPKGSLKVSWNSAGPIHEKVTPGVYFYRLDSQEFSASGKILRVR